MVLVTKKGINVMEFYLKNREFMASSEPVYSRRY